MKTLILVRGLPGSGKSSFVDFLQNQHCGAPGSSFREICTDTYMTDENGVYYYDTFKARDAMRWCHHELDDEILRETQVIVIHNTMTEHKEFSGFEKRGKKGGYRVIVLIMENRHGGKSVHNVQNSTWDAMHSRMVIQL